MELTQMKRPQIVNLELEDLSEGHDKTETYICRLENDNRELRKLLNECHHRFESYEMDVDVNRPDHHIDFMKRVESALGV